MSLGSSVFTALHDCQCLSSNYHITAVQQTFVEYMSEGLYAYTESSIEKKRKVTMRKKQQSIIRKEVYSIIALNIFY